MSKFKNAMVAAIIAVSAIGCSELAEDVTSYDSSTNKMPSPSAPADPAPADPAPDTTSVSDPDVDVDTDNGTVATITPEVIEDGCEAFGLVYDATNNTCVDDELETNVITMPEVTDEPEGEVYNFAVNSGPYTVTATWDWDPSVYLYRLEYTKDTSSSVNINYPSGTSWTIATFFCSGYSFTLVGVMADGSEVKSNATEYVKPSNCE